MKIEETIEGMKYLKRNFSGYTPNAEMFDEAIKALILKKRILERMSYFYYKDNPTEAEKVEYYALVRLLEAENDK